MDLPVDDLVKVTTSGASGMGLMALFARYIRSDVKKAEAIQAETNKKLWTKCDATASALTQHQIEDARAYVGRDEFSTFRSHMDDQFEKTRNMIFEVMKGRQQ